MPPSVRAIIVDPVIICPYFGVTGNELPYYKHSSDNGKCVINPKIYYKMFYSNR